MAGTFAAWYNRCVDALSFGSDYQKLRRLLNARIDSPASIEEVPPSHPAGFVREMKKRRISMVESYLVIIRNLESEQHRERIQALRLLGEQTSHAKNLTMPLNTARVQIALMKEAIKNRDNKRRQLECLYDFTVSSFGQASVIRAYLDELGIIELPETGQRLADMDRGWDLHVHDNSSYGRKTPSQLVIDAFIKGISSITVAFNQLNNLGNVEELLTAGDILGVRVHIGAEFCVRTRDRRFHFMYLLPPVGSSAELASFFARHGGTLRPFLDGLNANQESRIASIHALIENFNAVHLPALNDGCEPGSVYALSALDLAAVDEIVPMESLNRMYLGELLYSRWKPVLLRRVLLAKSKVNRAREELARGSISRWDASNIEARYEALRKTYAELNPENLRAQYFAAPRLSEYPTVFTDMEVVARPLKETGGSIKILHPLEHGLDAAYEVVLAEARWIDRVEVYNMYDSINRSVDDTQRFARFVNVLNSGRPELVRPFLEGHDLRVADADLERIVGAIGRAAARAGVRERLDGPQQHGPGHGVHLRVTGDGTVAPAVPGEALLPAGVRLADRRGAGPPRGARSRGRAARRHRQHGQVRALRAEPHRRRDRRGPHPADPGRALPQLFAARPALRRRRVPGRRAHHRVAVCPGVVRHHEPAPRDRRPHRPARGAGAGVEPPRDRLSATSRGRCSGRASRCRSCRS